MARFDQGSSLGPLQLAPLRYTNPLLWVLPRFHGHLG